MAIIESAGFQSQTVSLSEDGTPAVYQGTAILEPNSTLKSRTTVHPKAVRVRVSFAQAKITGLEEFLKRDFYVTLGDRAPEDAEAVTPPGPLAESPEADAAAMQKATEQVLAVNATIAEEDLLPLPPPGESKAYWKQVSDLISRNWSRQIRSIRRAPSSETVRVHFKMYASGVAQLIQLEKSSGARDVNDAGLQTIIHAHPFPPIPPDVGGDIVDVHVRMRTGAKVASRDVQMTVDKKPSKPPAAHPSPKDATAPSGSTKE
jgi:TonB family protein